MKILIHGLNYTPELSGVGKYTGEMGEWLVACDHEVRVVTAPPYYPAWQIGKGYSAWEYKHEHVAEAEVWRCPLWVPKKPSGLKRILHLASFAASSLPVMLWQVLWRPDVVIIVEPTLLSAPQAWLTARLSEAETWLHIQDFELDASIGLGILRGGGMQRVLYGVERFLMRRFSRVSTITDTMRQRVVDKGVSESRSQVFPNWSDIDFVYPTPWENEVRQEFGTGPEDVLVLYAGNMGEKQGLDLVLEVAGRLRERTNIKFAMVGAGTAYDRLERAARKRRLENLRFFPVQSLKRLPLILAAGDIHLVVQRREAADLVMPSKITNILAAGRPSIATTDSGTALHDVLSRHDCGLTTTPGNVEELTEAIVKLADDAQMREYLGGNARAYAEIHLDKGKILSSFECELRELVKEGV